MFKYIDCLFKQNKRASHFESLCNTTRIVWFNTNKTAQEREPGRNQYTFTVFKSIRKNALRTFYSQFALPRYSGKAVSILLLKELRKMHQLRYSFECVAPFTSCIFTSQCSDGWPIRSKAFYYLKNLWYSLSTTCTSHKDKSWNMCDFHVV